MNSTHMNMRNPLNANDALEELINLIQTKWDEHEQSLTDINQRYENGDFFDKEDSSLVDYHEGATEALSLIHHYATELYKNVK